MKGYGSAMAAADRDNTNGESDYSEDTPQEPGNPAAGGSEGGGDRSPAEGARAQGDLPAGADTSGS